MDNNKYIDEFFWSDWRKILTPSELKVPGLDVFGHCNFSKAIQPLSTHFHGNSYEFSILTKGHQIYYAENSEFSLNGGSAFLTYPYESHSSGNLPDEKKELFWFQLNMDETENLMGLMPDISHILHKEILSLKGRVLKLNSDIHFVLLKSFQYFGEQTEYSRFLGTILLLNVIRQIIESSKKITSSKVSDNIQQVVNYIENNIYEDFDLDELAKSCNLSLPRFKQRFSEEYGMPPREFINLAKINKSKELLLIPGNNITDVAFKLGYSSSSYFTVVFKRIALDSPTSYMRHHQRK